MGGVLLLSFGLSSFPQIQPSSRGGGLSGISLSQHAPLPANRLSTAGAPLPPQILSSTSTDRMSAGFHNHHRYSSNASPAAASDQSTALCGLGSNHGGIGSRHDVEIGGGVVVVGGGGSAERGQGMADGVDLEAARPWILNTDQVWVGAVRPALDVLEHLLASLEEIKASFSAASSAARAAGEEGKEADATEGTGADATGRGIMSARGREGFATSTAFAEWSHGTGELQRIPALESVDRPGEKEFTEGCLKVRGIRTFVRSLVFTYRARRAWGAATHDALVQPQHEMKKTYQSLWKLHDLCMA